MNSLVRTVSESKKTSLSQVEPTAESRSQFLMHCSLRLEAEYLNCWCYKCMSTWSVFRLWPPPMAMGQVPCPALLCLRMCFLKVPALSTPQSWSGFSSSPLGVKVDFHLTATCRIGGSASRAWKLHLEQAPWVDQSWLPCPVTALPVFCLSISAVGPWDHEGWEDASYFGGSQMGAILSLQGQLTMSGDMFWLPQLENRCCHVGRVQASGLTVYNARSPQQRISR